MYTLLLLFNSLHCFPGICYFKRGNYLYFNEITDSFTKYSSKLLKML